LATTHDLDEFAALWKYPLAKALAGNIVRTIVSAEFSKRGGRYDSLWSRGAEASWFSHCSVKNEIVERFDQRSLGLRPKSVLIERYPSDEIRLIEKDVMTYARSPTDRLREYASNNRDILIGITSFVAGTPLTSFMG
jgi:hypothetical protein